jgi:VanZ family protein
MAVISLFSTDPFSAGETGDVLIPLLRWLFPGVSPEGLELLHAAIRKAMHLIEFGILALLWYRALDPDGAGWRAGAALTAFLLAAGFAAVDESHQALVASRTASILDVGWDSLGAALGLVGRWALGRTGERMNRRSGAQDNAPGSRLSGGVRGD